jgi:MoaA/NifB/PqqE/SkfB family radical SAM enzyme
LQRHLSEAEATTTIHAMGSMSGSPEETSLPVDIVVELTNACNLACPLCSTHLAMQRPRGHMSAELFRTIVAELTGWQPRPSMSMTMCGEPLLHAQVAYFVESAAEQGLHTRISTNATPLTPTLARRLVHGGLSAITLCVDGATAQAHEAYRIGSRFEEVRRNCEGLMEIRAKLGSQSPRITVQTLLTAYSERQMDEVVAWARRWGADEVHFKSLSMSTHATSEQRRAAAHLVPARPDLRREPAGVANGPCLRPVRQSVVFWNGDLGLCCVDFNGVPGLGNCKNGLARALNAPEACAVRRAGMERQHEMCHRCAAPTGSPSGFRMPLAASGGFARHAAG